jgi:branched-chain amino acid transport system permease protein
MATATARAPAATRSGSGEAPASRRNLKIGFVAGLMAVFLCMVGLVQRFDEREVIVQIVSLGRALLLTAMLVAGYVAARPLKLRPGQAEPPPPKMGAGLVSGAVAGAIAGAILGIFVLLSSAIEMRSVFVAVTEPLRELISYGENAGVGALIQVASGAALGAIGAAVHLVAPQTRRPLLMGVGAVLLFSLFSRLFDDLITGVGDYIRLVFLDDTGWLYEGDGLTIFGALLVFAVTAVLVAYTARKGNPIRARLDALPQPRQQAAKVGGFFLLIVFMIILPHVAGRFISDVLGTIGLYVIMGLGLNIVVGYAGLLDLGYVAFFAVGAYSTAILTSSASYIEGPLDFWVAVPVTVVIAVIVGVLIGAPVLRLRGDYLAIVTLGFGEIVRILVISSWLQPWTGGAQGILSIPDPEIAGFALDDPQTLYYVVLAGCIIAAFLSVRLVNSRIGRSWIAMREDEQVAEAMGISIIKTKLLAFAMGAAIGSLSGILFAVKIGSVFPNSFALLVSILVLAVIVLGGMGSIPGVILGAFVLVGLPEILREFVEYRLLIYGALLVAIMILRPEGLIPSARRRLELHEEEEEQAQFEARHAEDVEAGAPVVVASQPKETS